MKNLEQSFTWKFIKEYSRLIFLFCMLETVFNKWEKKYIFLYNLEFMSYQFFL